MKVVYIAGPYSAPNAWEREQNIRAAEGVCVALWSEGVAAVCVHSTARYFHGAVSEANAIAIDDAILMRCDAIMLVEGWKDSPGTLREIRIADAADKRVYFPSQYAECVAWAKGHDA